MSSCIRASQFDGFEDPSAKTRQPPFVADTDDLIAVTRGSQLVGSCAAGAGARQRQLSGTIVAGS